MAKVYFLAAVLGMAAGLGCSSSSSGNGGGGEQDGSADAPTGDAPTGVSAQQACADIAMARCNKVQTCAPANIAGTYGSMAQCVTSFSTECMNALMAPWTGQTATNVEACAQAIPAWACGSYQDGLSPPPPCAQVMGHAPTGNPCAFSGQCQTGFCAMAPNAQCGICQAAPAPGADCSQLSTCGQGMVCTDDTHQCEVPAAASAACGTGAPCGFELSCVGATSTAMGTCQAAGTTAGATCDAKLATAPGCAPAAGLYCDPTTKQCTSLAQVGANQPCGALDGGRAECTGAARCVSSGGDAGPSTCVAPATEGASCVTADGPGCLGPDRCIVPDGGTSGSCGQTMGASCM